MTKRYYPNNVTLPVVPTALGWLLLDRWRAPSWGYGVFWTLMAILWLVTIIIVCTYGFGDYTALPADEIERRLSRLEANKPL